MRATFGIYAFKRKKAEQTKRQGNQCDLACPGRAGPSNEDRIVTLRKGRIRRPNVCFKEISRTKCRLFVSVTPSKSGIPWVAREMKRRVAFLMLA